MTTGRQSALLFLSQQLGKPYVWGGTGPDGYDCSGLVYAAYKAAGMNPQRKVASQLGQEGTPETVAQAQAGDLVYYNEPGATDHVGIYLGEGKMIDAPTQGKPVEVVGIGTPTSIRHIKYPNDGGTGIGVIDSVGNVYNSAAGAVSSVTSAFANWQTEALSIGLKVAAVAVCGGLLIVGAKQTVNPGA